MPGGRGSSFSDELTLVTACGCGRLCVTANACVEPHGTNLLRAERRRARCSLFSLYPFWHGGLNGFRAIAAASETERIRGMSGCLLTTRLPLTEIREKENVVKQDNFSVLVSLVYQGKIMLCQISNHFIYFVGILENWTSDISHTLLSGAHACIENFTHQSI